MGSFSESLQNRFKNRIKIQLAFWAAVGVDLAPQNEPKMAPNRPQEPPKTLSDPDFRWLRSPGQFLTDFQPPGTSKIELSHKRELDFQESRF